MKDVIWDSAAKNTVQGFSVKVRQELGALLMALQRGMVLGAPQAKPMRRLHANAFELRVKDERGVYRVFYVTAVKGKILVPHAFVKKTQTTPDKEIDTAKKRLRRLLDETK